VADLLSVKGIRSLAEQANAAGRFDAVIHNAGIGYREPRRIETVDGLSHLFTVNVLAPYLPTALITPPDRRHFYHQRERTAPAEAHDPAIQDAFLAYCAQLTGVTIHDQH
jgi:NAD(P)-dependent dehydrogenase (short-subunit alcohol dehydrogenase family)